jgi:hypothetical protein
MSQLVTSEPCVRRLESLLVELQALCPPPQVIVTRETRPNPYGYHAGREYDFDPPSPVNQIKPPDEPTYWLNEAKKLNQHIKKPSKSAYSQARFTRNEQTVSLEGPFEGDYNRSICVEFGLYEENDGLVFWRIRATIGDGETTSFGVWLVEANLATKGRCTAEIFNAITSGSEITCMTDLKDAMEKSAAHESAVRLLNLNITRCRRELATHQKGQDLKRKRLGDADKPGPSNEAPGDSKPTAAKKRYEAVAYGVGTKWLCRIKESLKLVIISSVHPTTTAFSYNVVCQKLNGTYAKFYGVPQNRFVSPE